LKLWRTGHGSVGLLVALMKVCSVCTITCSAV